MCRSAVGDERDLRESGALCKVIRGLSVGLQVTGQSHGDRHAFNQRHYRVLPMDPDHSR